MYTPPKLKYSPPQLYKSDINDLVEEEIMAKGGKGSGKQGHVTVRQKDYHWGTMRNVDTQEHSVPIHPEHWEKMKNVHEGHKEKDSFKDETGREWQVTKHPEGGIKLQHESIAGKFEHHVNQGHMKELDSKQDIEKGGPGSGTKGHLTPKKHNFSATMMHDHGDGSHTHTYLDESKEEAAKKIKEIKDSGAKIIHEKPHTTITGNKYPSIKFRPK